MESTTFHIFIQRELRAWKSAWTIRDSLWSSVASAVLPHSARAVIICLCVPYLRCIPSFLVVTSLFITSHQHHVAAHPIPPSGIRLHFSSYFVLFFILLSIESRSCGPTLFIHPFLHIFSAIAIYQDVVAIFSGGLSFDTPTTETSYKSCRISSSSSRTSESSTSHWPSPFSHILSAVVSSSSSATVPLFSGHSSSW